MKEYASYLFQFNDPTSNYKFREEERLCSVFAKNELHEKKTTLSNDGLENDETKGLLPLMCFSRDDKTVFAIIKCTNLFSA